VAPKPRFLSASSLAVRSICPSATPPRLKTATTDPSGLRRMTTSGSVIKSRLYPSGRFGSSIVRPYYPPLDGRMTPLRKARGTCQDRI
jgi:hypothetical protein